MSKEPTNKSPYKSRFGGGFISSDKYLAENMVDRKARAEGGGLPFYFWEDPYWLKQYLLQITHASKLLQKYEITAILSALKHPDAKRVYSLGLKSVLIPLIEREQRKLRLKQENIAQKESEETQPKVDVDTTQKPRQPFATKLSPLQKLREMDNG